jgi:hypothetical protein
VLFLDALPADVPGYGALEQRRAQLKAHIARLDLGAEDSQGVRSARVGRGRVCLAGSLPALLALAQVSREPMVDLGLGVVRRRLPEGHGYFVANLSATPAEGWVKLSRPARSAVLLDPMTRRSGVAALRSSGITAEIFLQLRPGESLILKTYESRNVKGEVWIYYKEAKPPVPLTGEWRLSFLSGGPKLPAPRQLRELRSWADADDSAGQSFGGTARYELEFELPAGITACAWRLTLGDVRETARVFVNGVPVGHVWSLPCDTLLTAPLKAGGNTLTLEVTSTAANRIRELDKRGVPWKKGMNFVNIGYQPFDASTWPVQPCGLLGPVRLVPLEPVHPEALK